MAFKYFTIFGAMRTGSNLLERSLDQYAGLSGHGELFNPQFIGKPDRREFLTMPLADRNADPIGLLNLLVEASPHAIPGFRIFDNHDQRVIDFAARDPNCAKIILRRNPVDSFVSLQIAQKTGQWMLMKDENRRFAKIRFEPAQYEAYLAKRRAHYGPIRRAAQEAGQPVFEVDYDDLSEISVLNGLARYIGSTETKTSLANKIQRQNPPSLADKVDNIEELQAHITLPGAMNPSAPPEPQPAFGALGEMIASKTYPLIYAPIPGAGVGEFKRMLTEAARSDGEVDPRLAHGLKAKHLIRRRWRGAFAFSFARHPAERILDVYLRRILRAEDGAYTMVQMAIARDYGGPSPEAIQQTERALVEGFDAFLRFVEDNLAGRTAIRVDPAWTPQSTLLAEFGRETPLDFIGRVERLDEDVAFVLGRVKAPIHDLAHKIRASFEKVEDGLPRRAWLTRDREEKIKSIFERDYARLGYDFLSE